MGAFSTLRRAFDESTRVLNVQVVAQVSSSDPKPTVVNLDEAGIWEQVFDPATNTIRVVEVLA